MKYALIKLVIAVFLCASSLAVLSLANARERLDQEAALQILRRATLLDSFAEYSALFNILGLAPSNFRSSGVTEQGTDVPKGTGQYVDLTPTSATVLAKAIKDIYFYGFIPAGQTSARMTLSFGLDSATLCIEQRAFVAVFAPLQTVYATDAGPSHLERALSGPNHKGIAAFFGDNGCAAKLYLTQAPYP